MVKVTEKGDRQVKVRKEGRQGQDIDTLCGFLLVKNEKALQLIYSALYI